MTRMTAKYTSAIKACQEEGIRAADAEGAYAALERAGYQWDAGQCIWIKLSEVPADPPTDLIRVRVWADLEVVDDVAGDVASNIVKRLPLVLVETSKVYPCRPPKQLEGRVYLTFKKKGA